MLKWDTYWMEICDVLESKYKNDFIRECNFCFYIGIIENCITYLDVENINMNNVHFSISHYRISGKCIAKDYYNPQNIVLDVAVRDIGEFIKSSIFLENDVKKYIKDVIDDDYYSVDDLKLLFVRLMYPSFFVDKVINKNNLEIDKFVEKYIDMLRYAYFEIVKKVKIKIPEWIIRKES